MTEDPRHRKTLVNVFTCFAAAAASLIGAIAAPPSAVAQDHLFHETPDPLDVEIVHLNANGNGCPGGLHPGQVTLADDAAALLIDYGMMGATSGANQPIADSRRVCSVAIQLRAPTGWTYRISAAGFHYGARMPENATGHIKIETWIQGIGLGSDSDQISVEGPVAKSDAAQLSFPNSPFVPCTDPRQLNFRNALWVPFGDNFARVRFQSPVAYRIEWQRCETDRP